MAQTLGSSSTAGTLTTTTSADTASIVCQSGAGGTLRLKAPIGNVGNVLVNLAGVHGTNDFAVLEPGDVCYYRVRQTTTTLTLKSSAGTPSLLVDTCTAG